MPANTEGRATLSRDNHRFTQGVAANTKIPVGVIAAINAAGFLVNASASTALVTVGVMDEDADNTGGADGAIQGPFRRGCFKFANSAGADQITSANWGASAYVVDNQTVAKTNGSNTRPVAGVIRKVEADGVWIHF